ncbi:DUF6468 domain-containing protein [Brevundimonas sp.]|uniref:DUF6468 domain-containing protein n=1 Tax=Brevundimonas sp. TaxID=1871086 RepID=UPI0025E64388|nr:DUF6468 domain-containing protein [Brevundimonas sp.]
MSATGLIMDGILILLLLAALMYGLRLEKKLKALREGQAGFAQAVTELNVAAGKAQSALAELRAASEETDLLHERIVAARTLKAELEGLVAKGRAAPAPAQTPPPPAPAPQPAESPARLLQALAARRFEESLAEPAPPARPAGRPAFRTPEDDLFEPVRGRA